MNASRKHKAKAGDIVRLKHMGLGTVTGETATVVEIDEKLGLYKLANEKCDDIAAVRADFAVIRMPKG